MLKASLYQKILLALSQRLCKQTVRYKTRESQKKIIQLEELRSWVDPLTAVTVDEVEPAWWDCQVLYKRGAALSAHVLLWERACRWAEWLALILSSLCRADILPGTVTARCCEAAGAGRGGGAEGAGPVVDPED